MISWYVSKDRIIQYFPASYNLKIWEKKYYCWMKHNQDGHTHHFVVDFVEVNFADFVDDTFTFKRHKRKACICNRQY